MSEQSLAVESETRAIVEQLPSISVVVPVFNEAAGIEEKIGKTRAINVSGKEKIFEI